MNIEIGDDVFLQSNQEMYHYAQYKTISEVEKDIDSAMKSLHKELDYYEKLRRRKHWIAKSTTSRRR